MEYRKAMAIYQKLADADPSVTGFRAELANNHLDLGILLSETGRPAESEAEQRKAIALYQKLSDDDPNAPGHRVGLAGALYYLGDVIRALGRPAEAREDYERAIAIQEKLVKENPNPWYRSLLAHSLRRRGLALRELGDLAGAAADTRRALGLYDGLASRSGEERFETACCRAALAGLAGRTGGRIGRRGEGEADQAMALLRKAVDIGYRKAAPPSGPSRRWIRSASGRISAIDDGPRIPARAVRLSDASTVNPVQPMVSRRAMPKRRGAAP